VTGDFDALLAWLYERLGRELTVSLQRSGGNVRLHAHGALARGSGDITLIEAARGRVVAFDVGESRVILLEGEFVGVEFDEADSLELSDGLVQIPARATADFGAVLILFGDVVG
jgi:hypothetical protein